MKSKLLVICSTVFLFTSCELLQVLNTSKTPADVSQIQTICVWINSADVNDCRIEYWLKYWSDIEDSSWPERKKQIEQLSAQEVDVLKKVLLSQGKSTPYQDRLRAQSWLESILPKLSHQMRRFMLVALYHPSQDLLEMESALVTLSKINTHQSSNIEEQQILIEEQQIMLEKQKNQMDQLLNIETSIIETSIIESIEEDKK